jgi:arsenate reductase
MNPAPLSRRLLAEFLGSAFLAATVVGSGIAAAQLSPGDTGLQLLENAVATAAGLFTFILMFGPISGAHFNPVVSLVDAAFGGLRWRHAFAYIPAQVAGCIAGAIAANLMFDLSQPTVSHHLKKLREAGIVGSERRGLWAYYYVIPESLEEFSAWLS